MALAGEVRVGELVHQGQLRTPTENRPDVQLREVRIPVRDGAHGKQFQVVELGSGPRSPVPLPLGHDGFCASAPPGACIPQHRVGLSHSGSDPEVGAQLPPAEQRVRILYSSPGDQVRAFLGIGPDAAGHRWIHSDMVIGATVPVQTLSAGYGICQRSLARYTVEAGEGGRRHHRADKRRQP